MSAETEKKIKLAITRIEKGRPKVVTPDRKLSIASVAEEAGFSRSTIINRYPLLAQLIRDKSGLKSKTISSEKQRILELERKLSEAKEEITLLKKQLAKAISFQASTIL